MKPVLRVAVGVFAVGVAILGLPQVAMAAMSVFPDFPLIAWPDESALVLSRVTGLLTAALWLGLALVSERTGAKWLFAAAAFLEVAITVEESFYLISVIAVASVAPARLDSAQGLPGWLHFAPILLVAAALYLSRDSFRWLAWAATVVLVSGIVREFLPFEMAPDGSIPVTASDQVFIALGSAAQLALLLGIAYWSFVTVRGGSPSNNGINLTHAR